MNSIFDRLAKILDDYASFEASQQFKKKMAKQSGAGIPDPVPCEGCKKTSVFGGGICPDCISLIAGACRWKAKK